MGQNPKLNHHGSVTGALHKTAMQNGGVGWDGGAYEVVYKMQGREGVCVKN